MELKKEPKTTELSKAEIALINEASEKYGHMNRWKLRDLTQELPEWEDPCGSAISIEYEDILKGAKKTPKEITAILKELESLEYSKNILGE